jgi:hypothetical protein
MQSREQLINDWIAKTKPVVAGFKSKYRWLRDDLESEAVAAIIEGVRVGDLEIKRRVAKACRALVRTDYRSMTDSESGKRKLVKKYQQEPDHKKHTSLNPIKLNCTKDTQRPDSILEPGASLYDADGAFVDGAIIDEDYAAKDFLRRFANKIAACKGISVEEVHEKIDAIGTRPDCRKHDECQPEIEMLLDCGVSLRAVARFCGLHPQQVKRVQQRGR